MNTSSMIRVGGCVVLAATLAGGCEKRADQTGPGTRTGTTTGTGRTVATPNADNTERNAANASGAVKSPIDQSNGSEEIRITAEIRRAIMDDKAMSTNAQNCKVITQKGGVVTLRGPVESQAEKDSIEVKARAVAGVVSVSNELEVKTDAPGR